MEKTYLHSESCLLTAFHGEGGRAEERLCAQMLQWYPNMLRYNEHLTYRYHIIEYIQDNELVCVHVTVLVIHNPTAATSVIIGLARQRGLHASPLLAHVVLAHVVLAHWFMHEICLL